KNDGTNMNKTITGRSFLDAVAADLSALLSDGMEAIFGPTVNSPILGPLTAADLGVFICFVAMVLVVNAVAAFFLRRDRRHTDAGPESRSWRADAFRIVDKPLYLLIWVYGIYLAASPLMTRLSTGDGPHPFRHFFHELFNLGFFAALFWAFFRFTNVV